MAWTKPSGVVAYKGYLITKTLSSGYAISKDEKGTRYHIAFADSLEAAKRTINELV